MTRPWTLFAATMLAVTSPAWAEAPSPIDRRFAVKAAISNTFEIKESQLALRRSTDPHVRAMARWMIEDHIAAQKTLEAAAAMTGTEAGRALDDEHEAKIAALAEMDGAAFDGAYVKDQLAAHEMTVDTLGSFKVEGTDPALLRWSTRTLPGVELHLKHFEALSNAAPGM